MNKLKWLLVISVMLLAGAVLAQRSFRGGYGGGRYRGNLDAYETPRQLAQHSDETPLWTNAPGFERDVFTFVRIIRANGGYGGRGGWDTDTPDSDLNLSWRLSQMTSMKVSPDGRFLRLTDKELLGQPFLYMVEPGSLYLDESEALALRKHLLNGGFLWLDDFWGEREWANMADEMKKVLPDRNWVELPLDHPLYHCVFEIKSKGQIPNVQLGTESQFNGGITWERSDAREVHHRAIFDDQGRIMAFATHNSDNGDGWEWEGNNHYYFEHFAEKTAYPLAINVVFYAMTH